jgi:hypothetical protein
MDPVNKKARISLRAAAVRDALEAKEHSHEHRPEGCSWHPEVCVCALFETFYIAIIIVHYTHSTYAHAIPLHAQHVCTCDSTVFVLHYTHSTYAHAMLLLSYCSVRVKSSATHCSVHEVNFKGVFLIARRCEQCCLCSTFSIRVHRHKCHKICRVL